MRSASLAELERFEKVPNRLNRQAHCGYTGHVFWEFIYDDHGQHASRLNEPGYRETIAACGVIVVEGFNDVIGLDAIDVPAVAIMGNKITEDQVAKIERFAKSLSAGKVTLLFDVDHAGDEGAKEALWLLAQRGLDVRLGWSCAMHGGRFAGRQPEGLTTTEWTGITLPETKYPAEGRSALSEGRTADHTGHGTE
jgi:Toprim domain